MSTRIVAVEDDVLAGRIMQFVLENEGYNVTTVHSGKATIPEVVGRETDLLLIDVNLPDYSGFDLCAELRARRYQGPVIFVSAAGELSNKLEGFHVGGDDYLVKPYEPAELIARVESIIRRYKSMDRQALGAVVRVGDAELSISNFTYASDAVPTTILAPTEMRILECLMRNSGIVFSRDTLIERTWGYDYVGDSNRVDVYIRRLRRKIEADPSKPTYLHTVRGLGYVFRPDGEDCQPSSESLQTDEASLPDATL
jgi:two-component system, OmpR family, response regulator RegX3